MCQNIKRVGRLFFFFFSKLKTWLLFDRSLLRWRPLALQTEPEDHPPLPLREGQQFGILQSVGRFPVPAFGQHRQRPAAHLRRHPHVLCAQEGPAQVLPTQQSDAAARGERRDRHPSHRQRSQRRGGLDQTGQILLRCPEGQQQRTDQVPAVRSLRRRSAPSRSNGHQDRCSNPKDILPEISTSNPAVIGTITTVDMKHIVPYIWGLAFLHVLAFINLTCPF